MISYDEDFYSWTQEQAELLRTGQFNSLDIPNLIEEIETMGRSETKYYFGQRLQIGKSERVHGNIIRPRYIS